MENISRILDQPPPPPPLPQCTGGVIEYAAVHFDAGGWQRASTSCALSQPDLVVLLAILTASLLVLTLLLLIACCSLRRRVCRPRRKPPSMSSSASSTSIISPSTAASMISTVETSLQQKIFSALLLFNVKPTDFIEQVQSFIPLQNRTNPEVSADGDDLDTLDGSRAPVIPLSHQRKRIFRRGPRCCHRYPLLVSIIVVALLATVGGTVYTCLVARQIELTANGLTKHVGDVVYSTKMLANTLISEAYEIINGAVREDVARTNEYSELRPFIEEMKGVFGDQAMRLYAMALSKKKKARPSPKWLRDRTSTYLHYFNIFLRRLSSLFAVAPVLGHESVKSARDVYYSYSYELARLAPHPLFRGDIKDKDAWRSILILKEAAHELCKQPTSYFPTCRDVESYFETIATHIDTWPRSEEKRDLSEVTAYMRVPQLLNAEEYVNKWLPVAQDPTGSVPFLFDEFVVPEIDKERKKINQSLDALPGKVSQSGAQKYINISGKIPLVLAGVLTMFVAVALIVLAFSCGFCYRPKVTEPLEDRRMRKCTAVCLSSLAVVAALLCVVGVLLGVAGGIGQDQVCAYLFEKPQQTDKWLHHLSTAALPKIPALHEVLAIDFINIQLPQSLLTTLDMSYVQGSSSPFLQSIGMARPVNLTALLYSTWLNTTLYDLWYKDVWPKMMKANLSRQVPRVPLTKVVKQFSDAVKLDQTFDRLYVGNASEYLPEPSYDFYTKIGLALHVVSERGSVGAERYATYFTAVGELITHYKMKFDQVGQALDVVRGNKKILEPLFPLIRVGDRIMRFLATKSNAQLVAQFTNNTAEIWLNSRQPINRHVLPVVDKILDRLFPFPTLRPTYRQALSPVCPTETQKYSPLFQTLRNFGFALSLSSLVLSLVCVVRVRVLR